MLSSPPPITSQRYHRAPWDHAFSEGRNQTQLTTVKTDLDAVKSDAKSQFASEINAVDSSYTTLTTSATAATSAPSATTLATAAAALVAFASSVQTLVTGYASEKRLAREFVAHENTDRALEERSAALRQAPNWIWAPSMPDVRKSD